MERLLVADLASRLGEGARGRVVVCGSHGGLYSARLAALAGVRAVVMHDAGIGRHSAGIAGVAWLDGLGIPACALDYRSCRINDGRDMLESGVVSMANRLAAESGCLPGHSCRQVVECLLEYEREEHPGPVPEIGETRLRIANSGHRNVWALDSASLAGEEDRRAIVVCGSPGALVGGRADDGMFAVDAFAAFFNDAGGGKDDAGYARLPVLEARGIAAATVGCHTARIGDGRSTYDTGVISRINESAARLELREGMSVRVAVARLVGLG